MRKFFYILIVAILPLLVHAQDMALDNSVAAPQPPAARVEITYIANSGFLFASGTTRILVDALYQNGDVWEAPDKKTLKSIISGSAPFRGINYLLVSHYHADHFDAGLTSRFLVNNPKAMLLTNLQTDSVMKRSLKMDPEMRRPDQVKIINAPFYGEESFDASPVKVRCMVQRHMTAEDHDVATMGFLMDMGGKKILHMGDADYTDDNFAAYNIQNENIDVALIHYWFLLSCEGKRIIDTYIKPKKIIVTHIPYDDLKREYKRIKEIYPDVEVFLNHLDKKVF